MAGKQSIFNIKDFRGGYATDLHSDLMADNELLRWRSGYKKRGGISKYASCTGSMRGAIRVYEETAEAWYTIYGVDDGSTVEFQVAATSEALTTIAAASLTGTTTSTAPFTSPSNVTAPANFVEFDAMGGRVIAVNGTDRPVAIIPSGSGTFYVQDLDRYDERVMASANWLAGVATTTSGYTDDTTDAQTSTGTFYICSATDVTNGFYVGGDFVFSRLIFSGVSPETAGSATGTYQYYGYNSSGAVTWTDIGTFNSTFVNASAGTAFGTGTVIGEWEMPLSTDGTMRWRKADAPLTSQSASFNNRYMMRGLFAGVASTVVCDNIELVSHTHYLTQITGDQPPQAVKTHRNAMYLAAGNQVQVGVPQSIKGWRANRWEYFYDGGSRIMRLESLHNSLIVIKEGRMFAIDTSSWENFSVSPLADGGTISPRGVVVANNALWMIDRDGIYMFDGNVRRKASKHIQTDIDSYTLTDAALYYYKTDVMVMFPTNSVTLLFDPDTVRTDEMGDIRVSYNKWTPYFARQMIHNKGGGDDGNLILLCDNYIGRGDYLTYDKITATTSIDMRIQTKLFDFGGEETYKNFLRCKPKIGQASSPAGNAYEFKFLTEDASNSTTLVVGTGTGVESQDVSVPYDMDGKLISMELRHNNVYPARVDTIAIDSRKRRY